MRVYIRCRAEDKRMVLNESFVDEVAIQLKYRRWQE